jgi:SAM-dependent methyltransferase
MAALGFLEADGTRYRNTPLAAAFLAGRTGADLRPFLRFWDRISYPRWDALENVLRHGTATHFDLSPEEGDIFAAGVEALTAGAARALVASHDWDRRHRLLDVGGGTGSFLLAALEAQPQLSGTVLEVEPVASVARRKLASSPHAARARVVTGDALADPLPAGHDVVLVANLAHLLSPERNRLLLSRLRAASEPGTALLLVDFWTDPTRTQPRFAALMAGEFAMFSDEGDVYSGAQVREWLAETGWGEPQERPLAGPQTLIAATAV